jgi:hypothetical protein
MATQSGTTRQTTETGTGAGRSEASHRWSAAGALVVLWLVVFWLLASGRQAIAKLIEIG